MISPEEVQKVREATDLAALVGETVALRPQNGELWGCCPFHHEKSPSFHIRTRLGTWFCFGCQQGGDCFKYVQLRDNVEFPEAVHILADRAGIELKDDETRSRRHGSSSRKARLFAAMEAATAFYHAQLTRVRDGGPAKARSYLAGRGMGSAVADRWNLGYAPGGGALIGELTRQGFTRQELIDARLASDKGGKLRDFFFDRVIIPICNPEGRVIALGGRSLDPSAPAKYINSGESTLYSKKQTVFALDRAKSGITAAQEAIIVEGYFDAISMHEAGISNVVAPCGTALTPAQMKRITSFLQSGASSVSRGRIVCLQDADSAGQKAAERAFEYAGTVPTPMYRLTLPDGKDPDEFLRAHPVEELRSLLDGAVPLARYVVDRHIDQFDTTTPEGRVNALADVVQAMGPVKGTPLGEEYVQYVADRLMTDATTVRTSLARVQWAPRPDYDDAPDEPIVFETRTDRLDLRDDLRPPATASAPMLATLLPGDARMIRVEREVLATIAADVDASRAFADRVASIVWADPRDEAIAWALLATPEGTTPLQAIGAAESVVPEGATILAAGDSALASEQDNGRALNILLDDLEMKSLRRQIDQGRARLNALDATGDPDAFNTLFAELTGYQRRLKELETGLRAMK
ncbi:MAG: DNA primase [Coriobacteriia bacterium]|nr:DNA primase [Coriobacteriia bacterium]